MLKIMMAMLACVGFLVSNSYALEPVKVTASGYQEPNRPENTLDDDWDTRWSCQGTCWIQYDFGEVLYMERVQIHWRNPHLRTQTFDVEVSKDGSNWDILFSGESEIDTQFPENSPMGSVVQIEGDIRYIRITGYGNSFNDWNSLERIHFHPYDTDLGVYPAAITEITASNVIDGNTPDRAYDQDFNTFWTGGFGDYIQFELEDTVPLQMVNIAWMNGHLRRENYAIDISLDGESWERLVESVSTGRSKDYELNLFDDFPLAKYVRVYGYGNDGRRVSSKPKISVTEVEIIAVSFEDGEITAVAGR